MANIFGAIIGMVLAVVSLTGVVMPTIKNVNTTGWSSTETTLIGLGGICVAAGVVYTIAAGVGIV